MLVLVLGIAIWIGMLWATRSIAAAKGLSTGFWGIVALFIGPLAILLVALAPGGKQSAS